MDAQTNMGLRFCPHMPEDIFSLEAAHIMVNGDGFIIHIKICLCTIVRIVATNDKQIEKKNKKKTGFKTV